MSLEENKAVIRRLVKAFNKHNVALLDELVAPDFVEHTLKLRGRESIKQIETMFYTGFPDFHGTIEDIVAEGDKVWIRVTYTGTHTGKYLGLTPSGKKITITAVQIYRIVAGKVVERVSVSDSLNFLKQLGVIEYTEKAKKLFPEDVS